MMWSKSPLYLQGAESNTDLTTLAQGAMKSPGNTQDGVRHTVTTQDTLEPFPLSC